jgi:hydroxymethylbilane synthase
MLKRPLRIGARGSPLSLAQTRQTRDALGRALGVAADALDTLLPIVPIVTTGDRIQDRKLLEAGGKGLFTKEIDEALLDGRVDAAIHSLKDVPTHLPEGMTLAAVPEREDVRDALLTPYGADLASLKPGAVIGTASLRRQAQLLHARPDLRIMTLRGNVDTRIARMAEGGVDATLLALSGLRRLGRTDRPMTLLDPAAMPPAVGQGALAVAARTDDADTLAALALLDHAETHAAVRAERAFLSALDGSCRTAIGAFSRVSAGEFTFIGEALAADGSARWRREGACDLAEASALAAALGAQVRAEAGDRLARDV